MNIKNPLPLTAQKLLFGLLCVTPTLSARAQTVPATQTAPLATRQLTTIPLRFVPARLMAWWLDPQHTLRPPEVLESQAAMMGTRLLNENVKPQFAPPKNMDWVWPDDGANQVLVYGTPQWIAKTRAIVEKLDVRQPMIVLSARIVRMSAREIQALDAGEPNSTFALTTKGHRGFYVAAKRASYIEEVDRLCAQGRVKREGSAERTFANNLGALLLTASTPLPPNITALAPQGIVTNAYNVSTIPTLNNDGTMTIVLNFSKGTGQNAVQVLQTLAITRENNTLYLPLDESNPDSQLIFLISAHAVRDTNSALPTAH